MPPAPQSSGSRFPMPCCLGDRWASWLAPRWSWGPCSLLPIVIAHLHFICALLVFIAHLYCVSLLLMFMAYRKSHILINHWLLLIAYCLSLIAYCLLFIVYCISLLHIASTIFNILYSRVHIAYCVSLSLCCCLLSLGSWGRCLISVVWGCLESMFWQEVLTECARSPDRRQPHEALGVETLKKSYQM